MNVAVLGPADRDAAVALWTDAGLTRPWNEPAADFARALAGPASAVLGVRHDGALVATAMVGADGHRGWLYYVAVRTDRRGTGIGRALVRAAEAWLAERGVPKVQLMVRHDNPAATGFWRALGYQGAEVAVLGRRIAADG